MIVVPITLLVICMILYTMFKSFKWVAADSGERGHGADRRPAGAAAHGHALQRLVGRRISGAVRRFGADRRDHAGIHQPASRARATRILDAAMDGSVQRLRPIMMTMLVASFGLLPAALSRGIGSDSQRPFAIVIVGGLVARADSGNLSAADAICVGGQRQGRAAGDGIGGGVAIVASVKPNTGQAVSPPARPLRSLPGNLTHAYRSGAFRGRYVRGVGDRRMEGGSTAFCPGPYRRRLRGRAERLADRVGRAAGGARTRMAESGERSASSRRRAAGKGASDVRSAPARASPSDSPSWNWRASARG